MKQGPVSRRTEDLLAGQAHLMRFFTQSRWAERLGKPGVADFVAGNPQEPPLPEFVDAVQRWTEPRNVHWFAYKQSERHATEAAAAALRERRGVPFQAEDVFMTTGAFAGLSVTIRAVADPGDEIVYVSPPWFFYDPIIRYADCRPVRVSAKVPGFDLDVDAIARAITPATRAVIVNTPNNPTGRIYPPDTLQGIADVLSEASDRTGRRIYLLSDEAYCRIVFDGRAFHSPTAFYPWSFLIYTYGKTLLTPGQRLGYVAVPPEAPDKDLIAPAMLMAQMATSWAFPNAVLQYAMADLEALSIDIPHLQAKRDRMVETLRQYGYDLHQPAGTFYLLPRSPIADDHAFTESLAQDDVFVLPGSLVELPGYFRISLTASDEMIDLALPRFAQAAERAAASAISP
jgi:aspartate aminotransferase